MNAKRCKKIRKLLAKTELKKVEMVIVYARSVFTASRMPTTFKYPHGSFQRTYRDLKKGKA
jgi:hypothetical protein